MQLQTRYVTDPDSWGQEHGVFNRAEVEDKASIVFQSGPAATRGLNGVMPHQLMQIVLDQLKAHQRVDDQRSRERSICIQRLQEAQHWEEAHHRQRNTREATVRRKGGKG